MSTLLALFRRLLFRRRPTNEKLSDESQKSTKTRAKSLVLPASQNSFREKNRINVKRGSQVVIRNRSQSVIVERKHVSRSVDKQSSPTTRRQSHFTIQRHSANGTNLAPTLSSTYRNRSSSAVQSKPTVIYIYN